MALKWGIIGAGRISHDFMTAIRTLPEANHRVVAVAGRDKAKVQEYATEHQIPKAYGDYNEIAQDKEVEVTYIGNLNTQHFDTVKLMLEHGKHVVCEKPFTMNEKQTTRLAKIARDKKLFLMEAVWSRFFPAYIKAKEIMESGGIGDVLYCSIVFGHSLQHVERLTSKDLGGGAILDLRIYILQFQQFVFRGLNPIDIVVNGHKNSAGTDETAGAIITYPGGKTAMVLATARLALPNEGLIVGTKGTGIQMKAKIETNIEEKLEKTINKKFVKKDIFGTLRLPLFWCPTQLITDTETYEWPLPDSKVPFLHKNSAGLAYEAEEARKCIRKGLLESPSITLDESIEIARLMDLMRTKLGVLFPEDSQEF